MVACPEQISPLAIRDVRLIIPGKRPNIPVDALQVVPGNVVCRFSAIVRIPGLTASNAVRLPQSCPSRNPLVFPVGDPVVRYQSCHAIRWIRHISF